MSDQTKEQGIGYILQASLKSSVSANELINIARESKSIEVVGGLDNYETLKMLKMTLNSLGFSDSIKKEIISNLHYAFDGKTIEEAEDVYNAFMILFPSLMISRESEEWS